MAYLINMARKPKPLKSPESRVSPGLQDAESEYTGRSEPGEKPVWVRIGPGGRIVIPAPMRKALGIVEGDKVQVRLDGEDLRIVSLPVVVRRVQEFVAEIAPADGRSWTDELIEERRREAEREELDE